MGFVMSDIEQVMQVIRDLKEIPDVELHLDLGEVKLSVWKGNIGDSTRGSLHDSRGAVCSPAQPEQPAVAAATAAVKPEEPVAAPAPVAAAPAAPQGEKAIPEGMVAVRASFTGVFYRKPSPTEPSFVEVGGEVEEDTTICLIEVMKCFSSIIAGVKGRVEEILIEDGTLVEIGQVMFLIRPS